MEIGSFVAADRYGAGEGKGAVVVQAGTEIAMLDEDRLRAEAYILLAMLLAGPPKADTLEMIAGLRGDDSAFGQAVTTLAATAKTVNPAALNDEYHDLFIGLDAGELIPYGSYYMDGALYSRPLAKLRMDMARLGIARAQKVSEPEDHIAALCEMMAGLILGSFVHGPASLEGQKQFFEEHLSPWAPRFFEELEAARSASFYMPVGRLGREFMLIERQAFEMIG